MHWTLLLTATFAILLSWQYLVGEPHQTLRGCLRDTWHRFGPCFVILLMVLPVVVHDTVKFSNRLAGPLLRLRNAMQRVANNEHVRPIQFRKGDFCQDLAEHFNAALLRLQPDNDESDKVALSAMDESDLCESLSECRR
jgi:hypothetical protein